MPRGPADYFDKQERDRSDRFGSDVSAERSPDSTNQELPNNLAESDPVLRVHFGRSKSLLKPHDSQRQELHEQHTTTMIDTRAKQRP